MGHIPNLPLSEFKGKSRIGNYGDKMMEGDYHVGQIMDALKQLGVDEQHPGSCSRPTTVHPAKPLANTATEGTPDMGNSLGPFRGELGEATEGSIRTLLLHPLAGPRETEHNLLRDVLDHGLLSHSSRAIIGAKVPDRSPYRRR